MCENENENENESETASVLACLNHTFFKCAGH